MQGIAQKILAAPNKYSIQELTRAVQAGVIPAYIAVPIIQSKVQEQKQMQMAQQAQGAQPNQPPIAQQVMAEAQGVGALPTNLPQSYAHGGIVAFEEGGVSNKYETPYDRMNRLAREAAEQDRMVREAQAREQGIMPYGEQMRNLGSALVNAPVTGIKHLVSAPGYGFSANAAPATTPTAAPTPTAVAPAPETAVPPVASDKVAPTKGGGISDLLSGLGIGLGGPNQGIGIGGESALGRAPGAGLKAPNADLVGQTQSIIDAYNTRADTRANALDEKIKEANGKVTGKAYEGLEASLRKEAEEFGADKEQAKNMALFKAGLAMMAGTSRHALENIGKGAMVGAEDYQAAAKDLKKARKENERAMAMVEQARRAEAIGDRDKAVEYAYKRDEALDKRDQFGTQAIANATGKSAELANDIWKTTMSAQSHLAATDLAGRYHLASSILGSMGKDRNQTIQERRLQLQFEKDNPIGDVRAAYAKQLGIKAPAPGVDKKFDDTVNQLYSNKFQNFINGTSYGAGAGDGGGVNYGGVSSLLDKYAPQR